MYQNIFLDSETYEIHLWDDELGYSTFPYKRYAYVNDDNGTFMSLKGKKVKRVGKWSKEDETSGKVHEADIHPETRILIDQYLDSDEPSINHRIMILDIEVSVTDGFPEPDKAENEVTAIAFHMKMIFLSR